MSDKPVCPECRNKEVTLQEAHCQPSQTIWHYRCRCGFHFALITPMAKRGSLATAIHKLSPDEVVTRQDLKDLPRDIMAARSDAGEGITKTLRQVVRFSVINTLYDEDRIPIENQELLRKIYEFLGVK